jgi:hypothetical protein
MGVSGQGCSRSPSQSPSQPRKLWTFKQYVVDFLNVSERTGAELEAQGLLADPVILGPRLKRYIPEECEAKARSLPRTKAAEPEQLRRARIDRMKAGPAAAA